MKTSLSRYFTFAILGLLFLCRPTAISAQTTNEFVTAPDLRDEILAMAKKDQDVQMVIMQKMQAGEEVLASDWSRKDSVFVSHIKRADEILDKHEWPGFKLVGADGSQGFFLIVQHADSDTAFQKKALKHLKNAYKNKDAAGINLAYLTDRVLVAEGEPQQYGTQLSYDEKACPVPGDINNPEEVDVRRAEMGIEPLGQYIKTAITAMGKEKLCS